MNKFNQPTGALPPYQEWMNGHNEYTICFVDEAFRYLENQPKTSPIRALEKFVNDLLLKKEVLVDWYTVDDFMNSDHIKSLG